MKRPAHTDFVRVQSNDSMKFHNKFNNVLICLRRESKLSVERVYTLLTMFSLVASIRFATFETRLLCGAEQRHQTIYLNHFTEISFVIMKI